MSYLTFFSQEKIQRREVGAIFLGRKWRGEGRVVLNQLVRWSYQITQIETTSSLAGTHVLLYKVLSVCQTCRNGQSIEYRVKDTV